MNWKRTAARAVTWLEKRKGAVLMILLLVAVGVSAAGHEWLGGGLLLAAAGLALTMVPND